MEKQSPTIHIEVNFKSVLLIIGTLVVLYLLFQLKDLFINLFISFIFMSALKPSVDYVESRKIPRLVAALLVMGVCVALMVSVFIFALPPLLIQTKDFVVYLSKQLFLLLRQADANITPLKLVPLSSITQNIPDITGAITHFITALFGNIFNVVTLFFFTLYFLLGIGKVRGMLQKFLNEKRTELVMDILSNVEKQLGAWQRGELFLMFVIGIMSYIGLLILKINYALPLAVIAGILEVFPIIGPTLSAVPAFIVASTVSWPLALAVIALYVIIQQFENNIIVPIVMRHAVGIPPLAVLLSLIIGQSFFGYSGILLAIPLVVTLTIIFREIVAYREKHKNASLEEPAP